jgi:hypothetical protein
MVQVEKARLGTLDEQWNDGYDRKARCALSFV